MPALAAGGRIRAVCFDGFPLFDPRPVLGLVGARFPDHPELAGKWFTRIFAHSWLRTSAERYTPFDRLLDQALEQVAGEAGVALPAPLKAELLGQWLRLGLWDDVLPALDALAAAGIRLAFLSNFTEEMLRVNARNNGIEARLDYLSTDRVERYKPHPRAYAMGLDHFGLARSEIAFCAFGGWDALGASWFGYPTAWINRLSQPAERLDPGPIMEAKNLSALLSLAAVGG
ncbi:MAG: haloacid dehalogenase type II [Sphingomonadales bacterium]|nr:haloacid dehalogenase type II [Sphingomonadales bacterium]MBD3774667.1 haloacid dehalogenase type II [Paracoccaceae bacterium]